MKWSFIVIGRNEARYLSLCLESLVNAIEHYQLEAELLYIDSQSTDDSCRIARSFKQCKVFRITGQYNAAIARNIGAREARGEALCFLDGDMELQVDFLQQVLDEKQGLKYKFVSGNFINHYYNTQGEFLKKDFYQKIYCKEDTWQSTTGGLFAIQKSVWQEIGGMNPKFKRGQDLDLGYRLAKSGTLLLRKKETMAIHHTVDYKDSDRLWGDLKNGAGRYSRSVLYRDHWNNKYVLKRMLTSDPTMLALVALILTGVVSSPNVLLLYPLLLLLAVAFSMRKQLLHNWWRLPERILFQFLRDVQMLSACLFFYPTNKVEYQYEAV